MSSKILCLLCVLCFSAGVWAQDSCDPDTLRALKGAQTWDDKNSQVADSNYAVAKGTCQDCGAGGWEWTEVSSSKIVQPTNCAAGVACTPTSVTILNGTCHRKQGPTQACSDIEKEGLRARDDIDKAKDTKSQFDDASKAQDAVLEAQNKMKDSSQAFLDNIQKAQDDYKAQVKQATIEGQKNAIEGAQKIREQTTAIAKMTADKLAEASVLQGLQNAYNNKVASDTGSVLNDLATACYYGNQGSSSSGGAVNPSANAGPGGAENVMSSGANAKLRWNSCIIRARGKLKAEEDEAYQKVQVEINRQSKMAADLLAAQQNLTAIQGVQQANQTNTNQDLTDAQTKYQALLARLTMKNSQDAQSNMAAVSSAQMRSMQASKDLMTNQPKLNAVNKYNGIVDRALSNQCCPSLSMSDDDDTSSGGSKKKGASIPTDIATCKKYKDTSANDPTQQAASFVQMLTGFQNAKNGGGSPMMSIPGVN